MDAQRRDWLGTIRLQPPRPGWVFFGLGLLAIVAVFTLLICGHYTRHEQVSGTVVSSGGSLTITPTASGIVTHLLVREGDPVHAGQPLIEISGEQDSASLGNTHAAIATQLQFKRNRLEADLAEQQDLAGLQQQDLHTRLVLLHEQITQMDQQIALQQDLADNAMALYDQWSKLSDTGIVSKLQVGQQHNAALQNLAQLKGLRGQHLQLQQQAEQLQGALAQIPTDTLSKRNETERQLADVAQSLAQNAAQRAVILSSPSDGTVANVLVHPGQAVAAQQSLMTVLPARSTLRAELWVPTKAVGLIHPGKQVMLRYEAYPYQQFGQHIGWVYEVSRSAVSASEVSRLLGKEIKEQRYRVEVTLDAQSVLAFGQTEALKPGMALDADVLLDRRPLIDWVLEPMYGFIRPLRGAVPKTRKSL